MDISINRVTWLRPLCQVCSWHVDNKAKRTYLIMLIDVLIGRWQQTGSNSFIRDAMPLRNLKTRRLRSVFRLWSWQPTTLNLSILLLCIHENRRRFESQNGSNMALFSALMCSCGQRITRHNANYAQMPGCPLCSIIRCYIILAGYPASLETLSPGLYPPHSLVPLSPLSYSSLPSTLLPSDYPASLRITAFPRYFLNLEA